MSSIDVDYVKIEKAKAIARYRRFRKIAKLFQMLEIIVALSLLSWSTTRLPAVMKISGEYVMRVSVYLLSPHAIFLIGNAIIIALVVLSRQNYAGYNTGNADMYDDYVRHSEIQQRVADPPDGEILPSSLAPETERKTDDDYNNCKQIVCLENAVSQPQCDAVTDAIEEATKQIRRFQRTQSEKLKREIAVKPRRELRRSETETRDIVVISGERRTMMASLDNVDSLSNEEFRLTIDAYIEKHQRFFKAQTLEEQKQ
ncbi:unnamed protein product [Ilex paraguariensis]|uniref:DUF4408 domain-containing protein n=1 Tax=Ilex paraguariensis TaxID=185542 RepID=A0ABC8U4Z5_9AQUA